MSKHFIFVSCGQFTPAEKGLGKAIVQMVKDVTGLDAFFAEEVQDLNGLDASILHALHKCVGFITVMHPRGQVTRPDGTHQTRASVWIEQEIAIATYIQRIEKRVLPVIAFIHNSVGREGLRDLLHLNPIAFISESEVLEKLPPLLREWTSRLSDNLRVQLESKKIGQYNGHDMRRLSLNITNDTGERIASYDARLFVPAMLIIPGDTNHGPQGCIEEKRSDRQGYRYFETGERNTGPLKPKHTQQVLAVEYCLKCAFSASEMPHEVLESECDASVYINGREYVDRRSIADIMRASGEQVRIEP
jgi:hypothetical protein